MNVFEDLVIQLKEEKLLERTVIEIERDNESDTSHDLSEASDGEAHAAESYDLDLTYSDDHPTDQTDEAGTDEPVEVERNDSEVVEAAQSVELPKKPTNGNAFYKRRAVGEISNLQMVEHVFTGVEREYLKIIPRSYDDFEAKKALNAFLQVSEGENSQAHAEAEFAMMQETEAWCTALGERDKNIPVSSLRQFCENSKPALSSQALLALARFYRNLPYSEAVRSKFDFMMTRLFSRPSEDDKRVALFTREEMVDHVNMLYREWSSIPLYDAAEDDSHLLLTALSFDELAAEAEQVSSFDQLISSDFFNRLRGFKESINELFMAPMVIAATIESNVRIGNVYMELIGREHEKTGSIDLQKYGDLNLDQISDLTGRSLAIEGLLNRRDSARVESKVPTPHVKAEEKTEPEAAEPPKKTRSARTSQRVTEPPPPAAKEQKEKAKSRSFVNKCVQDLLSMNKWLALASIVLVTASIGIYVYSTFYLTDEASTSNVQVVAIDSNSPLTQYMDAARISGTNFYGVVQPSWEALPKEKRQDILSSIYKAAAAKGCTQVTLLTKKGKPAGFASETRTDVAMP